MKGSELGAAYYVELHTKEVGGGRIEKGTWQWPNLTLHAHLNNILKGLNFKRPKPSSPLSFTIKKFKPS